MPRRSSPVLIVEDNAFMASMLSMMLRDALAVDTLSVDTVEEAQKILAKRDICAVLVDYLMPDGDGPDLITWLRRDPDSRNAKAPAIMVSGFAERARILKARDAGANAFLAKPVSPRSLVDKLTQAIERPRPFVQCAVYVGPCRRAFDADVAVSPRRRDGDTSDCVFDLDDADAAVVHAQVERVATLARTVRPHDRTGLRALRNGAKDTAHDARALRQHALADTAGSLGDYVTAVGLSGRLDTEVVDMHVGAMRNILVARGADQAQAVVGGLKDVVKKRLRAPAA